MTRMDNETMDLVEAAGRLGVTYQRAWALAISGELVSTRLANGRWLIDRASVDRLVEATRQRMPVAAMTDKEATRTVDQN